MRRRRLKHASKNNINILKDWSYCSRFWALLNDNLRQRYDTKPVHTFDEIQGLKEKFKNEIQLYLALLDGEILSGAVFFDTLNVRHLQYAATSESGRELSSNDLVNHFAIEDAKIQKKKYFDFGISTENQGKYINNGLLKYKDSFGSGLSLNKFFVKCL
jgi:lipid II:glycine glycyltransferase (peptidoglycan interpeptide bridge formation enzyme)